MSDVVALPKIGFDPEANLREMVSLTKSNFPFEGADWDDMSWNVTGNLKVAARQANKKICLHFTKDNGLDNKVKTAISDMKPFNSKELSDVVKCHVCSLVNNSPSNNQLSAGAVQILINSYRYLDIEISSNSLPLRLISDRNFEQALNIALSKLQPSTAYRVGVQFNKVSKFFNKFKLSQRKLNFKSPLKRSDNQTSSDTKIDTKSITNRESKLPKDKLLFAIGELSSRNLDGSDGIHQAITDIMFASGLRFDEVASLSTDCFYEVEAEEYNQILGITDKITYWELKYHGRKGGGFRTKAIADSLVPIMQRGVSQASYYFMLVRESIELIEKGGEYDFFPQLSNEEHIVNDSWSLFSSSNSNAQGLLKKLDVDIFKSDKKVQGRKLNAFDAKQLKEKAQVRAMDSIETIWNVVKDQTTANKCSELLFIQCYQGNHDVKSTTLWEFSPITLTQYEDFMIGREDGSMTSIFIRESLMTDEDGFHITSHQFRHFLNTVCQLSDSISELEIARYFGRKYIGDNSAYDHTNKAAHAMKNAQSIIDSTGLSREGLKDVMNQFVIVDRDEALETIEDLASSLKTSIGLCKHNFSDSPCGKHYACLRGCINYQREKGNASEVEFITGIHNETFERVQDAKLVVEKEFWGANNWLISQSTLLDGCITALAIESDESIPVGSLVQVFPDGTDGCEEYE